MRLPSLSKRSSRTHSHSRSNTLLASVLVCGLLVLTATALAQDKTPSETPKTGPQNAPLSLKDLEKQAQELKEKRLQWQDLKAQLHANKELVENSRERLKPLLDAQIAVVTSQIAMDSNWLKQRLNTLTQYRSSLKTMKDVQVLLQGHLNTRTESLDKMAKSHVEYEAALAKSLEIIRQLSPEQLKDFQNSNPGFDPSALKDTQKQLSEAGPQWPADLKQSQEQLKQLQDRQDEAKRQSKALERELARISEVYGEVTQQEKYEQEFYKKDVSALVGLYVTKSRAYEDFSSEFLSLVKDFQQNLKMLSNTKQKLLKLSPPIPEKLVSKARVPNVKKLEKDLLISAGTKSFLEDQQTILKARAEPIKKTLQEANVVLSQFEQGAAQIFELKAATAVISSRVNTQKLPSQTMQLLRPVQLLNDQLTSLKQVRSQARQFKKDYTGTLESDQRAILKAKESLDQLTRKIPKIEDALKREKSLAVFVEQVSKQTNEELVKFLKEASDTAKEAHKKHLDIETKLKTAKLEIQSTKSAWDDLEDPLLRQERERSPHIRRELLTGYRKLAGYAEKLQEKDGKTLDLSHGSPKQAPKRLERLQQDLSYFENYHSFIEERTRLATELKKALKNYLVILQEKTKLLESERLNLRRVYGCSEEIQIRLAWNAIKLEDVKDLIVRKDIRRRLTRNEKQLIEDRDLVDGIEAQIQSHDESLKRSQRQLASPALMTPIYAGAVKIFQERQRLLSEVETALKDLSEFEQKSIRDIAMDQMENSMTPRERALTFFSSERVKEYNDRILSLYQDVTDIDRKVQCLKKVETRTQQILQILVREEESLRSILPEYRDIVDRSRAQEAAAKGLIEASLDSSKAQQIIADIKNKHGITLTPVTVTERTLESLVDRLFEAQMRRVAYERLLDRFDQRVSRLGSKAILGAYKDDLIDYERRQRSFIEETSRIAGAANSFLTTGRQSGEIGQLRNRRYRQCLSLLYRRLFAIVMIPLLSWFVLALSSWLAVPIIKGMEQTQVEGVSLHDRDREQRRQTLVSVFATAWKGFVLVIAAIYLLKQLGVDITPLVASAGVAGLALAFGAQNLIKDFLAGFFILLENQYKIGDFVVMDDKSGFVEEITLRMTVLRGLDGDRHFMPNGEVSFVTNKTQHWSGMNLDIGVSYNEDPDRVIRCLNEVSQEMFTDDYWTRLFHAAPIVRGLERFSDSSVDFRISLMTRPGKQWDVARELKRRIKIAFDVEDIEIPFPQRVVHHVHEKKTQAADDESQGKAKGDSDKSHKKT